MINIGFKQFNNILVANAGDELIDIQYGEEKKSVKLYTKEKILITIPKRLKKKLVIKLDMNLLYLPL